MSEQVPIEAWHHVLNSELDNAPEEYKAAVRELLAEAIRRSVTSRIEFREERGDDWTVFYATVNPFIATIDTNGEEVTING